MRPLESIRKQLDIRYKIKDQLGKGVIYFLSVWQSIRGYSLRITQFQYNQPPP